MALHFMDSFDHYTGNPVTVGKWGSANGSVSINTTSPRTGTSALRFSLSTPDIISKAFTPTGGFVVGFALRIETSFAAIDLLQIRENTTVQLAIGITTGGLLTVKLNTTVLQTGTTVLSLGTYYYIEFMGTIHNSTGSYTLRINAVNELTATNVDTLNSGTNWDRIRFNGASGAGFMYIDDLYILDTNGSAPLNTFLGDIRVDARMPTAEGTTTQWTPSTGTDNALTVDEIPPNDDTDYNSTATVNNIDTMVVQDAPVVGATILGVQTNLYARKTDAGTASIAPVIRSGTDQVGITVNPSTTYAFFTQVYGTNPATSVAWTEAGFNAAEFGYKRIA